MKVQSPRAIQFQDIEGAPSWVERLLPPINTAIEQLNSPMQKALSHKDNLNSEIRKVTAPHESTFQVELQTLRGRPTRVTVSQVHDTTPRFPSVWWEVSPSDNRTVNVQVSFSPAPSESVPVTLLFEGD